MKLQRIIPQIFNTPQKLSLQPVRDTHPVSEENKKCDINNHFYRPFSLVNFQANPTTILQKELRTLKNVHCPTCGTRILNHDEFIKASKDVLLVNNTEDYLAFINKYRSTINPAFKNIINSMQKYIRREPEKSIKDITALVKSHYISKFKRSIDTLTKDYKNQPFFSEENFGYKEGILPLQELEQNPNFKLFITSLQNIIKDFPADIKQEYYEKYLNLVRETIIEINAFQFNQGSRFTITQNLCQNFLKLSSGKTTKMFKNSPAEIDVLSCKGCADFFHTNYTEVKKNKDFMFQYINDIAEQVVNKGALSQKEYPLLLLNNTKKYLKILPENLNPILVQLDKNELAKNFPSRNINFELIKLNGVPCAYCGVETHSHTFQKELEEQIVNAKNIAELAKIIQGNSKFIKERYLFLVEVISGAAKQNPNFDCGKLLNNLQSYVINTIHKTLVKSFGEVMNDYHQIISPNDKSALRDVKKAFFNELGLGPQIKKLHFTNYKEKLIDITNNIESQELKNTIWSELYERMNDLFLIQRVLFSGEKVVENGNEQLKVVIEHLLRDTLATIEHMDAKGKYKDSPDLLKKANELDNIIITCKTCNKTKRDDNMSLWRATHPEIIKHFKNYLAKIKEIKETDTTIDISQYDTEKVARKFEFLTGKKL